VKWRPSANLVTLSSTIVVCVLLYVAASLRYGESFYSLYYFLGLLRDNAYLGIAAVGLTFVILTGGIDLSVGAMVALTSIILARLVENAGVHPAIAVAAVLALGTAMGAFMGLLIHAFQLAPFFVTLAGMFFARGCALLVSAGSITITHPGLTRLLDFQIPLGRGGDSLTFEPIAFFAVAIVGMYLARWTRVGRFTYAIGGNEQSAILMGLPVGRTKIIVYAFSAFCSALAGVVWAVSGTSGNALAAQGMELDAIAAVVIGGTLLSGGVGSVLGTVVGVLICAIIGAIITFANLNTWWTRIAVGGLLLAFIVMQNLLARLGAVRAN
jgi:simple sugar transport system permease protein